jgi:hypothetical protein
VKSRVIGPAVNPIDDANSQIFHKDRSDQSLGADDGCAREECSKNDPAKSSRARGCFHQQPSNTLHHDPSDSC